MTKFSLDWYIAQSREAQKSMDSWPESMKDNTVVASAKLPVLHSEERVQQGTQCQTGSAQEDQGAQE